MESLVILKTPCVEVDFLFLSTRIWDLKLWVFFDFSFLSSQALNFRKRAFMQWICSYGDLVMYKALRFFFDEYALLEFPLVV